MPVTNPTSGDVHVSQPLTNFSQKWLQDRGSFVALDAMPNNPVSKEFDRFYEWNRGDLFRDEVQKRADGTAAPDMQARLSTTPYMVDVYALRAPITDRQRTNQDSQVRLERSKTQILMQKHMIRRERIWAATFFATGIWSTDFTPTAKWNAATPGDPIPEMRTGIRAVHTATGLRPNKVVFGRTAWDIFVDNDNVLARIEGGAMSDRPAAVQRNLVAQLLEIDRVQVMDGVANTAAFDDAESNILIGDDDLLIYYAPDGPSLDEPTAGTQFSWTGLLGNTDNGTRIKRFRVEERETDYIEAQAAYAYQVTAPELGYFIHTVSA